MAASAVGRPVEVHAYADRVVIRQDGLPFKQVLSFEKVDQIFRDYMVTKGDARFVVNHWRVLGEVRSLHPIA